MASRPLPPYALALLNAISGPESAGKYDVIYGGSRFNDFSDHPRKAVPITSGPNVGKTSSAAGKYQFLGPTWDQYKNKLGLPDFSPQSQDQAAWALASDSYRNATGGDLDAVLQSGDPQAIAGVGKALAPIWTSLPGGIEQGTNTNRFVNAFKNASPYAGMPDGPKGQEAYAPVFGSMAPGGGQMVDNNIDPNVAAYAFGEDKPGLGDRLQKAGAYFSRAANAHPAPSISGGGGDARSTGDALLKMLQNPQALAQMMMQRRLG